MQSEGDSDSTVSSSTDKFQMVKNALPVLMNVCKQQLPRPACGFTVGLELRMTADRGIGVFATDFIPAGTQIYSEGFKYKDYTFDHSEFVKLLEMIPNREKREFFLDHCWGESNEDVLISIYDGCFINHSREPTILYMPVSQLGVAARDLHPGDEITEDYCVIEEPSFLKDIRLKYGIEFYSRL